MIIGYALDHALGLLLSSALLFIFSSSDTPISRILQRCLESFRDCAVFFALSIEIAAIIVLVQEDWGKSTIGMGDYTVRITQAVAMLVLLALVYPLAVVGDGQSLLLKAEATIVSKSEREAARKAADAFYVFVFCWLLDAYPFFSKMNAAFGKSKVSKRPGQPGSVLDRTQFAVIEQMCFRGTRYITQAEDDAMTAFVILTYIPTSLYVILRIVWLGIERNNRDKHEKLLTWIERMPLLVKEHALTSAYFSIPLVACGLLWSVIHSKNRQEQMANSNGGNDGDNSWTFGQIVALTLFVPVLWECWRALREERERSSERKEHSKQSEDGDTELFRDTGRDKHSQTW